MSVPRSRSRLGVSEYVSAVILVIIVLGALVLIYAHFNAVISLSESLFSKSLAEYSVSMRSLMVITASYVGGDGVLHVIVSVGEYPVEVYGIYADDVLLEGCPSEGFRSLRPYDVVEIVCKLPQPQGVVRVKISYSGGLVEVLASEI